MYGLNFVNTRANLLDSTELLEDIALDKYSFVRDGYQQRRKYRLENETRGGETAPIQSAGQPAPAAQQNPVPAH
jgi:phospholipid-binding lipoprotein MlaA